VLAPPAIYLDPGITDAIGYQDAIDHRDTTINPGGCAPARTGHSVDVISQMSISGHASHLTDDNPLPRLGISNA
jgi:hypothetical protein